MYPLVSFLFKSHLLFYSFIFSLLLVRTHGGVCAYVRVYYMSLCMPLSTQSMNIYEVSEDLQECSVLNMFRAGLVTPNMSWS